MTGGFYVIVLSFSLDCLVRYKSGKPVDAVFQCPCSSGLTCHGNGIFDIPLGETGTYVLLFLVQ